MYSYVKSMVLVSPRHWLSFWIFTGWSVLFNSLGGHALLKPASLSFLCYLLAPCHPSRLSPCSFLEGWKLRTFYQLETVIGEEIHTKHEALAVLALFCPSSFSWNVLLSLACLLLLSFLYQQSTLHPQWCGHHLSFLGHLSSHRQSSLLVLFPTRTQRQDLGCLYPRGLWHRHLLSE